tara:strand:- start:611 stop:793 length:183 start_codon:yes stop_codon:yes gene_type:complete
MIEYRYKKESYLNMYKIVLLRLIGLSVTYGVQNGLHFTVSLAIGPFEPSIGFSIWKQALL